MSMETQKIKVDSSTKLSDIVVEFSSGKIRIPRWQRNYVWDRPRVVKLLNSIYREFPIGTFFFWEASPEYIHLYRNIPELKIPEPSKRDYFKFILDGQQRITSLYVAIKGFDLTIKDNKQRERRINLSEISFDLDKEEFVMQRPDNERFVSLSSILDEEHMDLFERLSRERKHAFNNCYKIFSTYPLSVVHVVDQDLVNASEIFERINQGGVKLSLFDLVVASTWRDDFDLKEEVEKLNQEFESGGFGNLDPQVYLQTLSLLTKGQAVKAAQLDLKTKDIVENWEDVKTALKLAVDFLITNLGVKVYDFIPYRAMLPLITYMFVKNKNKSLSKDKREFVEEWFWKWQVPLKLNIYSV